MKPRDAILLTIGITLLGSLLRIQFGNVTVPFAIILNAGLAFWVAVDSTKFHLTRYRSGISCRPVILFIAIALFWVLCFPWYLIVRHKITTGAAVLKDQAVNVAAG